MPSNEPGLLDSVLGNLFSLEAFLGLLVCGGALGYLTYEALLTTASELVAVAGGGAVGLFSALLLVFVGWRLSL